MNIFFFSNKSRNHRSYRLFSLGLMLLLLFLAIMVVKNFLYVCFFEERVKSVQINAKFKLANSTIRVCWILDRGSLDQVTFAFGSLIKYNPGQPFDFYFITSPNITLDTSNMSLILPKNSKIIIRRFDPKYAYLPEYSKRRCKWSGIIIVKLFLHKVLPDIDKIIYLDTDMINVAPIVDLWHINLTDKVFAGSPKIWYGFRWINSGIIFYNLANMRKQPEKMWKCANRKTCFVDDIWHSYCVNKKIVYDLPYRYNVDLDGMKKQENRTALHREEEKNVVFYHLMNSAKRTYYIKGKEEIPKMKVVHGYKDIAQIVEKLYNILQWVRNEIKREYLKKIGT